MPPRAPEVRLRGKRLRRVISLGTIPMVVLEGGTRMSIVSATPVRFLPRDHMRVDVPTEPDVVYDKSGRAA